MTNRQQDLTRYFSMAHARQHGATQDIKTAALSELMRIAATDTGIIARKAAAFLLDKEGIDLFGQNKQMAALENFNAT